jgi:hypothetical protein
VALAADFSSWQADRQPICDLASSQGEKWLISFGINGFWR